MSLEQATTWDSASRIRYFVDWWKRHKKVESAGLTGDYGHLRRLIDADMSAAEPKVYTTRLYRLVREIKPKVSVEIGVQRGCSTYAILKALEDNGSGVLHSIDIIPDIFFGRLVAPVVPGSLKHRWHYHEGDSRRILFPLLERLGRIDFAFHDADHTFEGQFTELMALWEHGPKAVWIDYSNDNMEGYVRRLEPSMVSGNVIFR